MCGNSCSHDESDTRFGTMYPSAFVKGEQTPVGHGQVKAFVHLYIGMHVGITPTFFFLCSQTNLAGVRASSRTGRPLEKIILVLAR